MVWGDWRGGERLRAVARSNRHRVHPSFLRTGSATEKTGEWMACAGPVAQHFDAVVRPRRASVASAVRASPAIAAGSGTVVVPEYVASIW